VGFYGFAKISMVFPCRTIEILMAFVFPIPLSTCLWIFVEYYAAALTSVNPKVVAVGGLTLPTPESSQAKYSAWDAKGPDYLAYTKNPRTERRNDDDPCGPSERVTQARTRTVQTQANV
jgi:hypothetical protein